MVAGTSSASKITKVVYCPSEDDISHFQNLPALSGNSLGSIPEGFPSHLNSQSVWRGKDLEALSKEWTICLTEQDIESIDKALLQFESRHVDISRMSKEHFQVSDALSRRLRKVSQSCYEGLGFCIVSGLNPDDYSLQQNIIVFAGLSAHIAPRRGFQDKSRKEVLCHVVNRTLLQDAVKRKETPAFTNGALSFHTDLGEMLALSTLRIDDGGQVLLASAGQVYNELAASRPDLIHVLSKDWLWDDFTDSKKLPPIKMPVMTFYDDNLITNCSRYSLAGFGSYERNPDLPPLTLEQIEALNAVHSIATRNALRLPNRKGDLLFVNNMSLLHARDALETRPQGIKAQALSSRHKLRLFLQDPERSWKIPPALTRVWDQLYGPNLPHGQRQEHFILEPQLMVGTKWKSNG